MSAPRLVDVARLGLGVTALARPGLLVGLTAATDGPWVRRTVRVLGGRYVVQSGGGLVLHRRWVPRLDAAVDLAHAASMVGLAALSPGHRRLALVSAGMATAFAAADLRGGSR